MNIGLLAQHLVNGAMLGVIYALVALGFSLFFGVLNIINFAHGDVIAIGAFSAYGLVGLFGDLLPAPILLLAVFITIIIAGSLVGTLVGGGLVLPLRKTQPVNVLLATLMAGTVLRELIRLCVPNGGNPKAFPTLLPDGAFNIGNFSISYDSLLILACGTALIVSTHIFVRHTNIGLMIRAIAQDSEVAQLSGLNFRRTVLGTFAFGSTLAAVAGLLLGLYYREINFNMGVSLGIIGFAAAVVGGLGSLLGPIVGGFLFAAVQTVVTVALPFSSAYKDVAAFGVVIVLIGLFPTGIISERTSDRV